MEKSFIKKIIKPSKNSGFTKALLVILVAFIAIIAAINPTLLTIDYFVGVLLRNMVEVGMLGLALTLIIITGGIDLSVGSIMVLSVMSGGMVASNTNSPILGLFVCLLIGALCGAFNALLIIRFRISPLIATLATMYLFMGIAKGMSKGDSVYAFSISSFLGTTQLGFLPLQLLIYAALALIFYLVLHKTYYGRYLYAIGLNENASIYSGIKTHRIKAAIYIISGLMASLASLIWLGRFSSVKYDAGSTLHMRAITIVVLGGTSITGGSGSISGTVLASLIIAVLNSGLTILNISIDMQTIVQGIVLILSLVSYVYVNQRVRKNEIIRPVLKDGTNSSQVDE